MALRIATVVTAVLFVAWLATLGVRLGGSVPQVVNNGNNNAASVLEAVQE